MSSRIENWQRGGFGLYIHWPFCQAKCPYCDFNSFVSNSVDQSDWCEAYLAEIDRVGRETSDRVLNSVFFGGGTPSLMSEAVVDRVLDRIRSTWHLSNDVEITLEANPTSVEAGKFAAFAQSGVNRISIGVQALNDADLRRLGRLHSAHEALNAIDTARRSFDRVSFDLIYARQDQSLTEWEAELAKALAFEPDHLSLYQLTIEPGTAFGDRAAIGKLDGLPDDNIAADMYFATQALCKDAGLPAYEISNHAKPDQESKHNLIYWRGGDYLGIGPGAHGRISNEKIRFATETVLSPTQWLWAVSENGSGESLRERMTDQAVLEERLMMGLRLSEGIDQKEISDVDSKILFNINNLTESRYLEAIGGSVRVTEEYRPVLNAILREILA